MTRAKEFIQFIENQNIHRILAKYRLTPEQKNYIKSQKRISGVKAGSADSSVHNPHAFLKTFNILGRSGH